MEQEPASSPLVMYGTPSPAASLEWSWVDEQLSGADGYWIAVAGEGRPHPRPVWGVWNERRLYLSIGSPTINAKTLRGRSVTAHLGSVTDVVIVEGEVLGAVDDRSLLDAYNDKYDWDYTVDDYGPLTAIDPSKVMAWRSGGWAGREGFRQSGRWHLRHQG